MKNAVVVAAIFILVAILAVWQWRHTSAPAAVAGGPMSLQAYAKQAALTLPRPYADGFSIVRVSLDGQRLVSDIRSADIAVADIDPAKLPRIRNQEQQDIITASCQDPSLLPAMQAGAIVVRRFFDRNDQPIFEVMAERRHCGRMM